MNVERINGLFDTELKAVNMGLESFSDNLRDQGVETAQVDWRPPADPETTALLDRLDANPDLDREKANQEAVQRILAGKPTLVDIATAREVVPGMTDSTILHAGPPVTWDRMCGPLKGAVMGGLIYEGLADDPEQAAELAASGNIVFEPCHHHATVGPMAGVVTPRMPVWVMENATFGNRAYCTLNEGLGKVLRYGANGKEVIDRLRWMEEILAPTLKNALERHGPMDMKNLIAQVLQMGDEGHNRNRAGTSLFIREIAPDLVMLGQDPRTIRRVLEFMNGNDHFFLNLSMPACKCTIDAAAEIEESSIIVAMARNGTDFGIRVSGLGDRWFVAPATMVEGLYLPGFTADDAAPDIGDSVITETVGIGGFAMAAAPAIVQFVGGTPQDAINTTSKMFEITTIENDTYRIPALDFRGTPTGIDIVKIVETGVLPAINTGIAHKDPGVGMVGAGLAKPPRQCFVDAFREFVERYGR